MLVFFNRWVLISLIYKSLNTLYEFNLSHSIAKLSLLKAIGKIEPMIEDVDHKTQLCVHRSRLHKELLRNKIHIFKTCIRKCYAVYE